MNQAYIQIRSLGSLEGVNDLSARVKVFRLLVGALAIFLGCYIYFVNNTIYDSIQRKNIAAEIEQTSQSIEASESQYVALVNSTDLARAETLGLIQTSRITFQPKISHSGGLSLGTNGSI
jgi:hypothetical protein